MSARLALRCGALVLVVAALFEPACRRSVTRVQPVFLVDVSRSVDPDSLAESLAWLAGIDERDAEARFVAFADQARPADDLDRLRRLRVSDDPATAAADPDAVSRQRSDLSDALYAARAQLETDTLGRIVLLSDGRADDPPERLLEAAVDLARSDVRLDVVPLRSQLHEPTISGLRIGTAPRAGAPAPVEVQLASPDRRTVLLAIEAAGAILHQREIDLEVGANTAPALIRLPAPGDLELVVSLDERPLWREALRVAEPPRVLLLAATPGGPLRSTLEAQGWRVRQTAPESLAVGARGRSELDSYDALVLSNVAAERLGEPRMTLIRDWVLDGGGLLFASGDQTFGEEGYSESPLETILPLRFNVEEERTDVALMIALDKSYSMKGPKIELAKEATKAALGELDDRHRFGVVAFDWEPYEVVPLDSARHRDRMLENISRIEASAQTNFYPALESCLRQLSAVEAEVRHVILLSDGKTYPDDYEGLIARMREHEITVSTVGVGSEADRELLADIARWGNGQTYFVQDAKRVQRILLDEARGKLEDTLVEEPVRAVALASSRPLTGVDLTSAPPLAGHLNLEPRQDSEVVLETDTGKPLLARRNVGLGRSWLFTSDLESRWSADWVRWPGFGALWSQVLHDAAGREAPPGLDFRVERRGSRVTALLSAIDADGRTRNGLDARLVARAGEAAVTETMDQLGPGRYRGDVELRPVADRAWTVELVLDGEPKAWRSVFFPTLEEDRPALADVDLLTRLSATTGGLLEPTLDQILDPGGERVQRALPLWPWLVALALVCYLIELALRRTGAFSPPIEIVDLAVEEPRRDSPGAPVNRPAVARG